MFVMESQHLVKISSSSRLLTWKGRKKIGKNDYSDDKKMRILIQTSKNQKEIEGKFFSFSVHKFFSIKSVGDGNLHFSRKKNSFL